MYKHGGGCHGGAMGFELIFRELGFDTPWVFDIDPYCQQVATSLFPNAQQLGDMTKIHNPDYVDVFTAGFPCQPFSNAGSMMGADDPRYLLPHVIRLISEVKPRVVLLENVPGFRTLDDGFHFRYLLRSLAIMGYDAEWGRVRASHVGAPHERKRWCLVAYANRQRHKEPPTGDAAPDQKRHDQTHKLPGETVQYAAVAGGQVLGNTNGQRELQPEGSKQNIRRRISNSGAQMGYAQSSRLAQRRNRSRQNHSTFGKKKTHQPTPRLNRSSRPLRRRGYRITKPAMGRNVDGLQAGFNAHRWPAGQGPDQYDYEPPRQIADAPYRAERIEALGNAIVPQAFLPLATAIYEWLVDQDEEK